MLVSELARPLALSGSALPQLTELKEAHARLQRANGRLPILARLTPRTGVEQVQLAN